MLETFLIYTCGGSLVDSWKFFFFFIKQKTKREIVLSSFFLFIFYNVIDFMWSLGTLSDGKTNFIYNT